MSRLFPGTNREVSGFPSGSKRLCRTGKVLLKVAEHRSPAGTMRFFGKGLRSSSILTFVYKVQVCFLEYVRAKIYYYMRRLHEARYNMSR